MARLHFREVISDQNGNVIAGASVQVYEEGTTTPIAATMYAADSGGTTLSNPLTTDTLGTAEFYLDAPQDVKLVVTKPGYDPQTIDHLAVGTGELTFGTSVTVLSAPMTGTGGVSTGASRADHTHTIPVSIPDNSAPGDTTVIGGNGQFAAALHKHAREPFGSPTASTPGDAAADGVLVAVPHADHKHGRESYAIAGASAPGDAASAGTGNATARANHVHSREGFGLPVAVVPGDTQSAGAAATIAHSDHRHAASLFRNLAVSANPTSLASVVNSAAKTALSTHVITAAQAAECVGGVLVFDLGATYVNASGASRGIIPTVELDGQTLSLFNCASNQYPSAALAYMSTLEVRIYIIDLFTVMAKAHYRIGRAVDLSQPPVTSDLQMVTTIYNASVNLTTAKNLVFYATLSTAELTHSYSVYIDHLWMLPSP